MTRARAQRAARGVVFRLAGSPLGAAFGLALGGLAGCTAMTGNPSLTLLSRADLSAYYEPVAAEVEVEECTTNVLFLVFFGNARPTHEGVIDLALEKHDAEILLDAVVTTTSYPFFVYNERCTKVRGVPARRRLGPPPLPESGPREPIDAPPFGERGES